MARESYSLTPLVFYYQLPRPMDWKGLFGNDHPLAVEIGCGNGDYLLRQAQSHPRINFLGIERQWEQVAKTLRKWTLLNQQSDTGVSLRNVRLLWVDASFAFERFIRPRQVKEMTCLFPDPWPKKKHLRHRLLSNEFLCLANSRLKSGGGFKIVTDDERYFDWILEQIPGSGLEVRRERIDARYETKYERKWLAQGKRSFHELNLIKKSHIPVGVKEDVPLKAVFVDHMNPEFFARNFPPKSLLYGEDVKELKKHADLRHAAHREGHMIFKDFFFDPQRSSGLLHLVVAEPDLTQHFWTRLQRTPKGWYIYPLEGHAFIPTRGIARALRRIGQIARTCQRGVIEEAIPETSI